MAVSLLKHKEIAPFTAELGLTILERSAERVVMSMPDAPRYENRKGNVHGGALAAMFDTVMGYCACESYPSGTAASTLALNISFIAAGNGALICTAEPQRRGKSIAFIKGEIRDAQAQIIATASANFKIFLPK